MTKVVFVTGMFRSGTTLLARILNAHPAISFASDPFARIFRFFRNRVSELEYGPGRFDEHAPLDDYYFYPDKQRLMRRIQETPFSISLGNLKFTDLRNQVAQASAPYSPKIGELLDELTGAAFDELFSSAIDIVSKAYHKEDCEAIGFKEVWTGEFVGHFLDAMPTAKALIIVRDPRAVCASKNVTEEKYPWLFLARQWRKLSTFAWLDSHVEHYKDRVKLVYYEELVVNTETHMKEICDFLDIPFSPRILDPTTYVDGAGKPWMKNTSYSEKKQTIDSKSIHKWRDVLTLKEKTFIESLCFPEMQLMGYEPEMLQDTHIPESELLTPLHYESEDLAEWIRPYSLQSVTEEIREIALEYVRNSFLAGKDDCPDDLKRALCLDPRFFDVLRS